MTSRKNLYLIDGSSYIYRAYYALPRLTNSKGFPTNAIYGFINMLRKLIREKEPEYLAVAFDHKAPTFRHEKYKKYKITRKPTPESLKRQLPVIKEIVQGYGIVFFEIPGYEADDVLAYIAVEAKKANFQPFIVSSDKDILQVVDKGIYVFHPQKNIILDESGIEEIYGIRPSLFADFLALRGDEIDNIPGVSGIGEKTAKELVQKYGSVEEILKNLGKLPPKFKKILEENKEQLLLSKELTKINMDLKLDINWDDFRIHEPDYSKLICTFEELGFQSLVKDMLQNLEYDLKLSCENIKDKNFLISLIEQIREERRCLFYAVKNVQRFLSQDSLALILAVKNKYYFLKDELLKENKELINIIFKDEKIEKISYGFKETFKLFKRYSLEFNSPVFDIEIVSYLLNPSWGDYSLEKIALNYLESGAGIASLFTKTQEEKEKSLLYCYIIDRVYSILKSRVKEAHLDKLYYDLEEPLIFILSDMEAYGIAVNKKYLQQLLQEYKRKIEKLTQEIYSLAGEKFNINSPKQLRKLLYDKLKLKPLKKGKTGPSTDEATLRNLMEKHPLPSLILKYRELNKITITYIEGLINAINPDTSKIHTTFNQTVTQTGRLSCSNPNLQNIPIKSELGKQIRKAFIPSKKNYLFLSGDYSQIELRILAHLSKDERLMAAFNKGKDIHKHTAAMIFGIDENLVSEEMRNIAKTVNFGIIYGISTYGLSQQLDISLDEASKFIEFYFQLYPGVKSYIEKTIVEAREKGYTRTLFNRIRYLPEINSLDINVREFGERLAINTPIQGTAADIIKKVMVDISRSKEIERMKARLLLQIHDELIFEVAGENLDLLKDYIRDKMENVLTLEVPLVVNIKSGPNWLDLQRN